jgi:hypothetical protein
MPCCRASEGESPDDLPVLYSTPPRLRSCFRLNDLALAMLTRSRKASRYKMIRNGTEGGLLANKSLLQRVFNQGWMQAYSDASRCGSPACAPLYGAGTARAARRIPSRCYHRQRLAWSWTHLSRHGHWRIELSGTGVLVMPFGTRARHSTTGNAKRTRRLRRAKHFARCSLPLAGYVQGNDTGRRDVCVRAIPNATVWWESPGLFIINDNSWDRWGVGEGVSVADGWTDRSSHELRRTHGLSNQQGLC